MTGLAAAALAQSSFVIEFESKKERVVHVGSGMPTHLARGLETTNQAVTLTDQTVKAGDKAFVIDLTSGNLALKAIPPGAKTLKIKDSEFAYVHQVAVRVSHREKPVAVGRVVLRDSLREQAQLMTPAHRGIVVFHIVRAGQVKATFEYVTDGEGKATSLTEVLELRRQESMPTFVVDVSDPVQTLEPTAAAPGAAEGAPASKPQAAGTNIFSRVVSSLIGLVLVAFIVYALLQTAKKHPKAVEEKLKGLGVHIPQPGQADEPDGVVPTKAPPPEPIRLPDADPAPIATGVAAVAAQPRLAREDGTSWSVPVGEAVVGRDASAGLALADETTVSRRHATLRRDGDAVFVRDEGSTNGTFVNGARLDGEVELRPGDSVQFGSVRFRYEV